MENCGKLSKSEAEVRSLAWNKIGYDRELTECFCVQKCIISSLRGRSDKALPSGLLLGLLNLACQICDLFFKSHLLPCLIQDVYNTKAF